MSRIREFKWDGTHSAYSEAQLRNRNQNHHQRVLSWPFTFPDVDASRPAISAQSTFNSAVGRLFPCCECVRVCALTDYCHR